MIRPSLPPPAYQEVDADEKDPAWEDKLYPEAKVDGDKQRQGQQSRCPETPS